MLTTCMLRFLALISLACTVAFLNKVCILNAKLGVADHHYLNLSLYSNMQKCPDATIACISIRTF